MENHEERILIGIDGGGTKTEFILFTDQGHILDRVILSGSNPNDIGLEKCCAVLSEGIDKLLKKEASVCSIFAGIAGCMTGDNGEKVTDFLRKRYPAIKVKADTDGENILSCNPGSDDGMALICGTGSVLFVREHGVRHRIGGWGYLFDGAGSAYDIGCGAVRAALFLYDRKLYPYHIKTLCGDAHSREDEICRRQPRSARECVKAYSFLYDGMTDIKEAETSILMELLKTELQGNIWESLHNIYRKGRPYIASLAPLVFQAYEKQDLIAEKILRKNAEHLAMLISTGMRTYQCGRNVIVCGGLIEHNKEVLLPMIREALEESVQFIFPDVPPVYGACVESCRGVNCMPEETFYHTFSKEYKETYRTI